MALIVGIVTYPDGFGRFIAGKVFSKRIDKNIFGFVSVHFS